MVKLRSIPHPDPAEFICLKRQMNRVKTCEGLDEKDTDGRFLTVLEFHSDGR